MSQPATVHILATDADVTITFGTVSRCYDFGLTGTELSELLESLGITVRYEYQERRTT